MFIRKIMYYLYVAKYIIGIDEVGRGPLAGPMMLCAFAVSGSAEFLEGIRDSKKLSVKKRNEWSEKIWKEKENSENIKIAIAAVAPENIDRYGISQSIKGAVAKCLATLKIAPDQCEIMLDGSLYAPPEYKNQQTIIKGDEKFPVISAASVVAKVYRDNFMVSLHKKYPMYGFDVHKGYGTVAHIAAIKKHGLSPLHRRSFCRNFV
ncbi:MAG: ribonuclease HII [bacterium]|nr:ribonuclease HII [bacterium]